MPAERATAISGSRAALAIVALLSTAAHAQTAAATDTATVNGLYPLWEHTGTLHPRGTVQVGFGHAQLGLGPVQLGTQPLLDLYGTLNGSAKLSLLNAARLRLALHTAVYHVPTAAGSRAIGNLHATGFVNPFAPVWLVPAALAATLPLSPRWSLHTSTTVLSSFSDDPGHRHVSAGQSLVVEASTAAEGPLRSARLHLGVEGWPVDPRAHVGLSMALTGAHAQLQLGFARRFSASGEAANLVMLDGALFFR